MLSGILPLRRNHGRTDSAIRPATVRMDWSNGPILRGLPQSPTRAGKRQGKGIRPGNLEPKPVRPVQGEGKQFVFGQQIGIRQQQGPCGALNSRILAPDRVVACAKDTDPPAETERDVTLASTCGTDPVRSLLGPTPTPPSRPGCAAQRLGCCRSVARSWGPTPGAIWSARGKGRAAGVSRPRRSIERLCRLRCRQEKMKRLRRKHVVSDATVYKWKARYG